MTITDHPLRYELANELHARPFPSLEVPCTATYLAIKHPDRAVGRDRQADRAHLIALLDRHGAPHPQPGATHYSARIGRHELKWESHTEFVTYTAFTPTLSARAFDPTDFEVFPADWLAQAPGVRVASAHIRVQPRPDDTAVRDLLADWFVPESLAVSRVLDDGAILAGDFRIDPAGHTRFAVFVNDETGARRVGRIVQRLCEVETYKSMSMLGFARVKQIGADLGQLEQTLAHLVDHMGDTGLDAELTLTQLLTTSATLEQQMARNSFRFGATGAYEALVNQRIKVLREERFQGRQTFAEFMMRRYDPAMRTVKSTEARLAALSDRARRAGELLRTRVDVERSAQNQSLLSSMDQRADTQLKLQKTVEGLSVVAISYYAVSLASYAGYPLAKWLGLSKGELTAALTLPVVAIVWWSLRRIQSKLH
ncbi:DUF3422 family protein [Thalassovita mediterranea]|jgi:uncharacterized membrane-anchored protein|uniref:DUF3422 domain-containing protein n=1 Tax=Thalassovita mediterranea TaxID=340021 RepID=A0A0P1GSS2_9RHOB|nr:DUF3422 domain-containing protein [Thalassovita mediterranea]MCG7572334.1 DUF3422 domain-containing protein [Phaeobacter sp. CNT1-3]CUH85666.1 hypothetical protein TM5383_02900 [Thalassovita mediterranea]SIS29980.1 Uncharacterized membrane-anchored protein [Thalassovita mediterranea]